MRNLEWIANEKSKDKISDDLIAEISKEGFT